MMTNRDVGCTYERAEPGSSAALRLGNLSGQHMLFPSAPSSHSSNPLYSLYSSH